MDATGRDWAHWDDSYRFVQGDFPEYVEIDLAPKSLAAYALSFVLYLDADGGIVHGTGFDPATETYKPLPDELATEASRAALGLPLLRDEAGHHAGLVEVDGQVHMVTAWAVLTSLEEGPVAGMMLWGSAVDDAYEAALREREGVALRFVPWAEATPADQAALTGANATRVTEASDRRLVTSTRLDDLRGAPILVAQVDLPRPILQQAYTAMEDTYLASVAIALAFTAAGVLLLRHYVVRPVVQLRDHIADRRQGGTTASPKVAARTEVGDLAAEFAGLMAELDDRTRELERSNKDLKAFASIVSHDLQSPVTTLRVNAALLRKEAEARGDAKALEQADRIERTSERMAERIRTLLDYARAARGDLQVRDVDLNAVVADVRRDLQAEFTAAGASLDARELPAVRGDPVLLAQVLQNLLSNAAKFGRPGVPPRIRVEAEDRGAKWAIHVHDNGRGFRPDEAAGLMVPFRRLANAAGTAGNGVGLASSRAIAERHGGRLEAVGRPEEGATFTLVLPK